MRAIQSSILIILSAGLFLSSCVTPKANVPQNIDDFVVKAQVNSSSYTQEDWDKSIAEYEKLIDEYQKNESSYSPEEKQKVANAMGRYHALLLENALEQSADSLKGMLKELADYTKLLPAYMDGFKDVLESDTLKLENIFSDIFASDPVKDILGSIGSLFGGIMNETKDEPEVVLDTLPEAQPLDSVK
jgi:hypothetical protein